MITYNDIPVDIQKFPNGESIIPQDFFREHHRGFDWISLFFESNEDLLNLMLVQKHTQAEWLYIPYMPYSRMDRQANSHIFTLPTICEFINQLEFKAVYVFEPHSDVAPALLHNCKPVLLLPKLMAHTDFDPRKDFVCYPDGSAFKKYSDELKAPNYLIGLKKRDFKSGKITSMNILTTGSDPKGKRVFIVDDLCSKGKTFVAAAEQLHELGASEIFLVVPHSEESMSHGKVFDSYIDYVYTTDTIIKSYTHMTMSSSTKGTREMLSIFKYREL